MRLADQARIENRLRDHVTRRQSGLPAVEEHEQLLTDALELVEDLIEEKRQPCACGGGF